MRVDLVNDIIFKAVFGTEKAKPVLKDLLNAVLIDSGFASVRDLTIKNPVIIGDTSWMKNPELDILVTGEDGKQYNVEMQIEDKPNFTNRSLYYWAKVYSTQMGKGDFYGDLKPVVCINFINFMLSKEEPFFHRCIMALDRERPSKALSDDFRLHFIEMPTVAKKDGKLATWVQFLQKATEDSTEEAMEYYFESNPVTKDAYGMFKDSLKGKEEYLREISRERWYRDNVTRYEYEKRKAIEQGLEQGLQKGLEQGLQKGLEQGKIEGKHAQALETAKNLLRMGLTVEQIVEATGLSDEEIMALPS